jgi:hypothetical protein
MLVTDGFSEIRCDDPGLCWDGDEEAEYADAVARQDRAFIDACRQPGEIGQWPEVQRLAECVAAFQRLGH